MYCGLRSTSSGVRRPMRRGPGAAALASPGAAITADGPGRSGGGAGGPATLLDQTGVRSGCDCCSCGLRQASKPGTAPMRQWKLRARAFTRPMQLHSRYAWQSLPICATVDGAARGSCSPGLAALPARLVAACRRLTIWGVMYALTLHKIAAGGGAWPCWGERQPGSTSGVRRGAPVLHSSTSVA